MLIVFLGTGSCPTATGQDRRIYVSAMGNDNYDKASAPFDDPSRPLRTIRAAYEMIDDSVQFNYHIILKNEGRIFLADPFSEQSHFLIWKKSGKHTQKSIRMYPETGEAIITRRNGPTGCAPMFTLFGVVNLHISGVTFEKSTYAFHLINTDSSSITMCKFKGDTIRGCSSGTIILEMPKDEFRADESDWYQNPDMISNHNTIADNRFEGLVTTDTTLAHTNHAIYISRGSVNNTVARNLILYPPGSGIIMNHGFQRHNKVTGNTVYQFYDNHVRCNEKIRRTYFECNRYGISVNAGPEYDLTTMQVRKTITGNIISGNTIRANRSIPNWNGKGNSMHLRYFSGAEKSNLILDNLLVTDAQ